MTWLRLFLVACGVVAGLATAPSLADPADIAAASRAVVRVVIVKPDGRNSELVAHGSGFAIGPQLVVTNAHVVDPAQQDSTLVVGVVPSEGKGGYAAHVVAVSQGNDLALIKLDGPGALPPLTLFTGAVADGAEVDAVGYPGNVDLAQGLSLAELVQPQQPVKTRGYVSAGRSSKQFDTLLHTAPIGSGNSGGPLLDACGRVVGVNSFGTVSDNGTDSAFYFAISMRELTRFLQDNQAAVAADGKPGTNGGAKPQSPAGTPAATAPGLAHTTDLPCTSLVDLDKADSARAAGEQARHDAELAARNAATQSRLEAARRKAELEVLGERDNGMAIAALLLVLATAAGGAAYVFNQRDDVRKLRLALAAVGLCLFAALVAWLLRPSLAMIDNRADALAANPSGTPTADASTPAGTGTARLVCVFDAGSSRVTVSDTSDIPLDLGTDGCLDGRTQLGQSASGGASNGWTRIETDDTNAAVTVSRFEPDTGTLTRERFLLGLDAMTKAHEGFARLPAAKCTPPAPGAASGTAGAPAGGVSVNPAAIALGQAQDALRATLPTEPNERLRYHCQPGH